MFIDIYPENLATERKIFIKFEQNQDNEPG